MHWSDINPKDAVNITLPWEGPDGLVEGPMNELGERCPWPWEPQQLKGAPMGQYHCSYCGGMNVAGVSHVEWTRNDIDEMGKALGAEPVDPPSEEEKRDDPWSTAF